MVHFKTSFSFCSILQGNVLGRYGRGFVRTGRHCAVSLHTARMICKVVGRYFWIRASPNVKDVPSTIILAFISHKTAKQS